MRKMNVAYLRVSTENQVEKYGLDLQRQKIVDYCEKNNVTIDRWYVDGGYSGSKLERPEIQKLLDDAENELIKTVYIYKLDRLSRDTADTLELMYKILPKYDISVISMTEEIKTENPMDKVMLTMNAAMNQYEREVFKMRTKAGMTERVKKGYWMGGGRVPWGYYYDRNDGILHIDEQNAERVRNAYKLYLEGYPCLQIAEILGFKGDKVVTNILQRKTYLGLIEYNGKVYKGLHEPIIDEETFNKTQKMMRRRNTKSYVSHNNLLTGLCWCGVCGARMRYQKGVKEYAFFCYSQDKKANKDYMRRSDNCTNARVKSKKVEKEVEDCFKKFLVNLSDTKCENDNKTELIEKSIKALKNKIKKMYDVYFQQDSENLLEMINVEENKLKSLEQTLLDVKSNKQTTDFAKIEEIKSITDVWDDLSVKDKNKILKECVDKIILTGDNVEIYFHTFLKNTKLP